jgi:outer membrane receptor for ferrienterochelin and colicin
MIKITTCTVCALLFFGLAEGQADTAKLNNLESMSLKDLLDVRITTASKISEESDKAPATVVVITEEQIKIRGYQSLLDVLKDLPDVKVDDKLYQLALNNFTVR